jgi:predicted deacetylase
MRTSDCCPASTVDQGGHPRPAQAASYLIRFDDICPTMNWGVWDKIEQLLTPLEIKPLLAVIPDNQDPNLLFCPPNQRFWQRVREWQARGWSIALHGYQHRYVNNNGGMLKLSRKSEFAGLPRDAQEFKLHAGLAKFEKEGIRANAWVAPSHSFDETTVQLLSEAGIRVISDGLTILPFEGKYGITWVPQQMWEFRRRKRGVWTVCFHHNTWNEAKCDQFCREVREFRHNIETLDDVVCGWAGRTRDLRDRLHELMFMTRFRWGPRISTIPGRSWLRKRD